MNSTIWGFLFCPTSVVSGLYPLRQTTLTPTHAPAGRGSLDDIVRIFMNIKSVTPQTVHFVETDGDDLYQYTRYGADNWTVRMGESDEPVYRCEELEAAFQAFLSANDSDHRCSSGTGATNTER
jgi:hypothetical protein